VFSPNFAFPFAKELIMNKKIALYLGFFIVLFVVFYFVLIRIIPGFGKEKMPVLSNVQPFFFRNQDGKMISNREVSGKVFVAAFFFTTCRGICPRMNNNLKLVYEKYRNEPDFRILSHTVDPLTDSVPRMKQYADSMGVDSNDWWFLTGRKDSLYNIARGSYLLDDPRNNDTNIDEQFIHTQFMALVDKKGQIRKIYDGLKNEEINALVGDIRKLLEENPETPRFVN
jgi:protein SCO1/2